MRTITVIIIAIYSAFTFAGPEDHIYDSCYTTKTPVSGQLPSTYCFEDAKLDLQNNVVNFSGYASNMPDSLKLKTSYQKNANVISFIGSKVVLNNWETGCGSGLSAELVVAGDSDINGKINPKSLSISMNYKVTNDTCHSSPSTGAVEYLLSK
jgi:hypothetical protein